MILQYQDKSRTDNDLSPEHTLALNLTRPVNFIGLSRFLQTVSVNQYNTDNVEIGNYPLRSTRYQ